MSRTGFVVVGVLLALSLAVAQEQPPALTLRIELRPGPPMGQSPEAAADTTPPQAIFDEGQPIDVAFIITNVGQTAYRYLDRNYDRSGRMEEHAVQVTDAQGKPQDDPRKLCGGGGMGGGLCGQRDLAPQASFTKHIYLNQWVMPLPPGKYSARGTYQAEMLVPAERAVHRLPFQSDRVEFEIRPRADMAAYVRTLAQDAQGEDSNRRVQAMAYLGFTGLPLALPYAVAGLYDDHRDNTCFQAGEAFLYQRDAGACREALLAALDQRGLAEMLTYYLQHYGVPLERSFPAVLKALDSPDLTQRALAANKLVAYSKLGEPVFAALTRALADPEPKVRSAAVGTLHLYHTPEALQALLEASHDPDEDVRLTSVWALSDLREDQKTDPVRARVREMLADTPKVVHQILSQALWLMVQPADLRVGLRAADPLVRLHTAIAMFDRGDDTARETIAAALPSVPSLDQERVLGWLRSAAEHRNLKGPPPPTDWRQRMPAWIDWLRQKQ
ncbi:MAG: HEAT repeat domain-containing protein [Armatimonadetes bacterium]|nr:HEAT repeat domain-containing protein [Armatimonadota bacterium]